MSLLPCSGPSPQGGFWCLCQGLCSHFGVEQRLWWVGVEQRSSAFAELPLPIPNSVVLTHLTISPVSYNIQYQPLPEKVAVFNGCSFK